MKTSSAKAKGRALQQYLCRKILEYFPTLQDDDVCSRSMGAQGTDVMLSPAAQKLVPCAFECKNVEKLSVWEAWKQTLANAKKLKPVLVIKRNRQTPLVVIDLDYFMELVKGREVVFVEKETI